MKVKELIEALSKLDSDSEVWKTNDYHKNSKVKKVSNETFYTTDEEGEFAEVTAYVIE